VIKLYPFQRHVITELRRAWMQGHRRQVLALPTGGGKTVVATQMIHNAARNGHRSMFVVDRIELVEQAASHLHALGLKVGILQGDNTRRHPDDEVVVASIQTLRSRGAPPSGLIIIDEAHILHRTHIQLMEDWNLATFIGLSATPLRPDLGRYFTNLVRGPSVQWLMDQGYLVPVRAYSPSATQLDNLLAAVQVKGGDFVERELETVLNRKELVGDIVTTWTEKAEGRPTLVFAINIAHSKSIIDDFLAEGVNAGHLDAYTPREERNEVIAAFRAGEVQALSSVNVLGIGFDVPDAACGILARPTLSEALHMQQMGRLIRPARGKVDARILDHAGNTVRFGLPQHFEVPDLGQSARNDTKQKRRQKRLIVCTNCSGVIEPGLLVCPSCGIDRPSRGSDITYLDGRLVEYGTEDGEPAGCTLSDKRSWYQAFLWNAGQRGHKIGWAFYAYQQKFRESPPWEWADLPGVEPTGEQARWITSHYIRYARRKRA